ncbi:hypothetical protein ZWY2020_033723 [Hordeum vulgare]|nr:hypothetical protein ZWY2020_033723 [Hordeum vulgare]
MNPAASPRLASRALMARLARRRPSRAQTASPRPAKARLPSPNGLARLTDGASLPGGGLAAHHALPSPWPVRLYEQNANSDFDHPMSPRHFSN